MPNVYMTGNTHFDPVWLWRWDEAMASIRATFRAALERMDEDEDFCYAFSAPAVFEWILKVDPELFARIKKRVDEGRWELGEGWWLQADAYTALGESLVRQGLYGQRWLYRHFGKTSQTYYGIDSFGHPETLPGILRGTGIRQALFCRPNEKTMPLPAPLFTWRGSDGTEMLAYRVGGEGCEAYADKFQKSFDTLLSGIDRYDCDRLVVYGVTDHGGAPTKECLRIIHDAIKNEKRAHVAFTTLDGFFDEARKKTHPVVSGALDVHFIGPSVNHSEVKQNCRRAERLALYAETASVLARRYIGKKVDKEALDSAWRDILFNEFHDIIGGCCTPDAYTDARDLHGRASATAAELMHTTLQSIVKCIRMPGRNPDNAWNLCVFNLSGVMGEYDIVADAQWAWEFPWYRGEIELVADDGERLPSQLLWSDAVIPGFRSRFVFRAKLPAYGWRSFIVRPTGKEGCVIADRSRPTDKIECGGRVYTLGERGGIASVRMGDRVLAEELLVPFTVGDICDTWGFNKTVYETDEESLTLKSVRITEDGCERTTVKQTLTVGTSRVEEYLTFHHRTGEVTCRVRAIWSEERRALRLRLTAKGADACSAGTPGGWISRPASPYEKPMNTWLALYGNEGGAAVTTDSVFAYAFNGSEGHLTVLRNALYGDLRTEELDPAWDAAYLGQGETNVKLTLHFFDKFDPADVERRSIHDNSAPVVILEANHDGTLPPSMEAARLSGEGLLPMAFKPMEDGDGVVLRMRNVRDGEASGEFMCFGQTYPVSACGMQIVTNVIDGDECRVTDHLEDSCGG